MHSEKITSPLTDIENISFHSFGGHLEKGLDHIECEEDILCSMRSVSKDLNPDKHSRRIR